ncbi:hypothetical protein ABZ891_24680 [Streptomyces sp. NPDC047023]|uniref:hypothetical protein n=1 Tax=Streptomyces sp. NPDC047023 TaxID=3155139 RepID=UPI0034092912
MTITQHDTAAVPPQTAVQEQAEAQELVRLRRQRDVLFLLLLLGVGALLAGGAAIVVRLAPSWADPAQVALGTLGAYVAAMAVLVPHLRRRR